MLKISRVVTAVVLGSILTVIVHADMVPISSLDTEQGDSHVVCNQQDNQGAILFNSIDYNIDDHLYPLSGRFPQETNVDLRQVPQRQNAVELKNEQSSLVFCLSALIGMGFCGSAHWMKKHSLGFIPEWYHSGGPAQIGHSFAISPDLLRTPPAFCFIQPVLDVEDSIEQFRLGIVISLWRKSQFTPNVLASRAPPDMS
jgi:hypothetical protein